MKNETQYQKTVNLLLDAYNDGELEHGNCAACEVGNICKESASDIGVNNGAWNALFMTRMGFQGVLSQDPSFFSSESGVISAKKLLSKIDYTQEELMKIEYAFEASLYESDKGRSYYTTKENEKKGQFIGLCAVLDVLKEIHEVKEDSHKESLTKLNEIYETIER